MLANNAFAEFRGDLVAPSATDTVNISILPSDFPTLKTPRLGFHLYAADGSGLDPAAVRITNLATNATVPPVYSQDDARAGVTDSVVLATLSVGDDYQVTVQGQNNTSGGYILDVYLAGDADGNQVCDLADRAEISSLLTVAVGNPAYNVAADANLDGIIESYDYTQWRANLGASTDIRPLSLTAQLSPSPVTLPDGRLVTNVADPTLVGTSDANEPIALEQGNDGLYDDGATTADALGNYVLGVQLTPGANQLQLRTAMDGFGQQAFASVAVDLDTQAPLVAFSSPAAGLLTNTNFTLDGRVADDNSGVATLEVALDGGSYAPLAFDDQGNFHLTTSLALDGTADGPHTIRVRATDRAGSVSDPADDTFTLDSVPPAVDFQLDAASDSPPLGDGHTQAAVVTLTGTTEPDTPVVLKETGASTTSDSTGAFSFTGVALALGANVFTVQATDRAGNTGTAQHTIVRDSAFDNTLVEGTRFLTPLDQTFTVPAGPSFLEFTFGDLDFDTSAHFIKDAFEASLTDVTGHSLVLPIAGSRDAFLNITEGQALALSPNVTLTGDTIDVDLSHIPAGTQARLQVRLVNNDSDTTTSVRFDNARVIAGSMNTPAAVTPAVAAAPVAVDFSTLADVTGSLTPTYGQTSWNPESQVLYADLTLQNTGTYPVDSPLVAIITHLSDPSVHVRGSDGTTPDGLPYVVLSGIGGGSTLAVGQSTGVRTLAFYNPDGGQFTYDLTILAHLNRPPAFTSEPNTEALVGHAYAYNATATDPDGDPLTFSLVSGPTGMTVDPATGRVTWAPGAGDASNQAVAIRVDDGQGGSAEQDFTLAVMPPPPNRPPVFTSTPVVGADVNTAYQYQAAATDPDFDPLTFALTSWPAGMTVDPATGLVQWQPDASQLGLHNVALTVSDGHGGSATQTYTIDVWAQPGDQPPMITSNPVTSAAPGLQYTYQVRAIDADGDTLSYSLATAPDGMTVDPTTGLISWTPGASQVGSDAVSVVVGDGRGGFDTQSFVVDVTNAAPATIQGTVFDDRNGDGVFETHKSQLFSEYGDEDLSNTGVYHSDPKAGTTLVGLMPGVVTLASKEFGHTYPFSPKASDYPGTDRIFVGSKQTAFLDGYSGASSRLKGPQVITIDYSGLLAPGDRITTFTLGVAADDFQYPTWRNPFTAAVNGTINPALTHTLNSIDQTGPVTRFFTVGLDPVTLTSNGKLTLSIDEGGNGGDGWSIDFLTVGITVTSTVADVGLPNQTVYLDLNHDGTLDPGDPTAITDSAGHYAFSNLAPGTYTVAEVGQPGWRQTEPTSGTYSVTVQAGQTVNGIDFGNMQVNGQADRNPAITSTPLLTATVGQRYRYDTVVTNPDGLDLTFDLPVHPAGMAVDPATGVVLWTPTDDELGPQEAILRLHDSRGDAILQDIHITVFRADTELSITSTPGLVAGQELDYQYQVRAVDSLGLPLTYQLKTFPAGMSIDPQTGLVKWTPTVDQLGTNSVLVVVTDSEGLSASQPFDLQVIVPGPNHPPTIDSTPRTRIGLGQTYRYAVLASDPDGDPLTYSLVDAPAGMTIDASGLIIWVPTAAQFGANAVLVQVKDDRDGSAEQPYTVQVGSQPVYAPPVITSTPRPAATAGSVYSYDATGDDPDGTPLVWSLDAAPAGMAIDAAQGTIRWTPTADELGPQDVVLRLTNGEGLSVTQSFRVLVHAVDVPPVITSEPPTLTGVGHAYSYAVQANDADGDPLIYTLTDGPAGMSIDPDTGLIQWNPQSPQVGLQSATVLVDDGRGGTATQSWSVVVVANLNLPPVIASKAPLVATVGQGYSYAVQATDPEGEVLHYSLAAAPAGMSVDPDSGLVQWTPGAGQFGRQEVIIQVADPEGLFAVQGYLVAVHDADHPPHITSTPIADATAGAAYRYDVQAADPDGDPLGYKLTSAPAGMSIDSLGRITWSPQAADIGSQPVSVIVSDGRGGTATQSFTIAVAADTQAPEVDMVLSADPADLGTPVTVTLSATDNVGIASLTLTDDGIPVALDAGGHAILPADVAGTFTLVATAADAAGNVGTATQSLLVRDPHVTGAPVVDLSTPADGDTVTAPTQVIGTVQDANLVSYTLSVAPLGSDQFIDIATGTNQVDHAALGTFDPTMLEDGTYTLRLSAINTGGLTSIVEQTVNVSQNLKLGNFTLSFTDLTVPVSGIPITVTRTYDTLTASQSEDFGYGWRLEFRDADLRTSVGTTGDEADGFFNVFKVGSKVYLTLPGGQMEGFTFQPKVADGLRGSFLGIFEPAFVPDPGVTDSLTVDPADLRIDADGTVYDYATGLPYNPADPNFGGSYLATTKDGIAYRIDGITGQLTEASDTHNNTLTYSDSGIVSSTGTHVTFERDAQGRIAAVVDPMGNRIQYQYDASGNLVSVTDRTNDTTQFVYRTTPAHYLDQVIDPLGHTGVRTDYDAQGRLTKVIDADGNSVQIAYDPTHLIQSATDQDGNTVIDEYDARGNLVSQTDAMGKVTTQTFDANNNLLTHTDPLGRTTSYTYDNRGDAITETDPLGHVTISSYLAFTWGTTALAASRGQAAPPYTRIRTTTDPLGNTTTLDYQLAGIGDPTSIADPAGQATTFEWQPSGNPGSLTDPDGDTTQYSYDGEGHVTLEIDPLGVETAYTYDANGDPLTKKTIQTTADGTVRILTTKMEYDADGRVIAVTDPAGGVTRTEYDAAGNVTATIDPLGRRTQYVYNDRNELIETIYPDDTPNDPSDNPRTQSEYDTAGRKSADIDEAGRPTEYQYDADGRLVKTIYPDGTSTQTEYDADGEVTAQIDELGNRTEFTYDADGQQTSVRDALGNVTTSTYDAAGRLVASTDALGNTTRDVYDARGFLTEVDYPDGTKVTRTPDNAGRLIAETDQLGHTIRYEYDADGRLTAVIDALGQRTEYAYDEAGDLISQTDANGHTTIYEYDALGRQTAVDLPTLPGQAPFRSTTQYDADGNVISTTDADGNTITYTYDARNRLVAKSYPDGSSVTSTYTATGQIASETDSRGTTFYAYDARDRLSSQTSPDGTEISYRYDAAGDRTALITPAGTTTYTFDALGREATATDPSGGVTHYTYDAAGNLVRTDLPNGTVETRSYDALNRLSFLEDLDPSGAVIDSDTYILGPTGLRDAVIESTGRRVDYTYDALDRLTEEKITDSVAGNRTIDYTYDPVGNRLTKVDSVAGTTTYVYDALDRLTSESVNGAITQYTYDPNGNTLSQVGPGGTVLYQYDFDNRLVAADTNGDGTIDERNVYDSEGNLVAQTVGGQETRYLIDTLQMYPQVVMEYRPGGLIVVSYVYGNSLISQDRGGVASYYLVDGLGSTRALTNAAGVVTDRYTYDAFGNILARSGSTMNTYLFNGQRQDATTGFIDLRARFMDPATGRFTSADSFPGVLSNPLSLNRYIYTAQDPVNLTDPGGHFFAFLAPVVGMLDDLADAVSSTAVYHTVVQTIRGLEDWYVVGELAFVASGLLLDNSRIKTGVSFKINAFDKNQQIQKVQGRVYFGADADANFQLAIDLNHDAKPDKFRFTLDLTHPAKSSFQLGGNPGGSIKLEIAKIDEAWITIFKLDLTVRIGLDWNHLQAQLGLDGALGPSETFRVSVKLLSFNLASRD